MIDELVEFYFLKHLHFFVFFLASYCHACNNNFAVDNQGNNHPRYKKKIHSKQ